MADWVREPASLWVDEITRSAPRRRALVGRSRVEPEVRAPCLVDDERDAVAVRDVGQCGDVSDRTEVRRRDDVGGDGFGVGGQRRVERLRA